MSYTSSPKITGNELIKNLDCDGRPNNIDAFTYKDIVNGNGMLKYPVGLLSAPEINLAGSVWHSKADYTDTYLLTGMSYWSMSPNSFFHSLTSSSHASNYRVQEGGFISNHTVAAKYNVRPVISLASHVIFSSGTGLESNPFDVQ